MNKEYERQVNDLNKVWHSIMQASNYKDLELKFKKIQSLSTTELSIIRMISEKEDIIIKDITQTLNLPKSTLTNIINRLENRCLINRAISDRDKRSYKLELTLEGMLVQKEHIEFEEIVYGQIIKSLDSFEEREQFLYLLNKIKNNLSKK